MTSGIGKDTDNLPAVHKEDKLLKVEINREYRLEKIGSGFFFETFNQPIILHLSLLHIQTSTVAIMEDAYVTKVFNVKFSDNFLGP